MFFKSRQFIVRWHFSENKLLLWRNADGRLQHISCPALLVVIMALWCTALVWHNLTVTWIMLFAMTAIGVVLMRGEYEE